MLNANISHVWTLCIICKMCNKTAPINEKISRAKVRKWLSKYPRSAWWINNMRMLSLLSLHFVCVVVVVAFCLCDCYYRCCILLMLLSLLLLHFVCVVVVVAFCLCCCRCCYCILFVLLSWLYFVCVIVIVVIAWGKTWNFQYS